MPEYTHTWDLRDLNAILKGMHRKQTYVNKAQDMYDFATEYGDEIINDFLRLYIETMKKIRLGTAQGLEKRFFTKNQMACRTGPSSSIYMPLQKHWGIGWNRPLHPQPRKSHRLLLAHRLRPQTQQQGGVSASHSLPCRQKPCWRIRHDRFWRRRQPQPLRFQRLTWNRFRPVLGADNRRFITSKKSIQSVEKNP